ncbi:MAG: hypothetical protein WCT13_05575 [Patescibacteria group bacterium]|jgi:hypothetical protein
MSRLYVTPRELNFISDITKEILKDVIGQKIIYYPISELKTLSHDVYNESFQKVYDNPIQIDALVDSRYQSDTKIGLFGVDQQYKIEVFIQYRDLVDKGLSISIGDFFSFSDIFYEVTETQVLRNIYGLPEHRDGIKLIGTKARQGQFTAPMVGPTDVSYNDDDAVQKNFYQQRGFRENAEGQTHDKRDLIENGILELPEDGPREVSERGAQSDNSNNASSFYDEES